MKVPNLASKLVCILVDGAGKAVDACTDGENDGNVIVTNSKRVFDAIKEICDNVFEFRK